MKHKALILFLIIGIAFLFSAGCKKNKPPETPDKPSGPAVVALDATNEYTTKTKDPNGDDIIYTFDWGDGDTTTTDLFPSESIAMASHAWADTGKYMVKVKAQDEKDAVSEWSTELEVSVKTNNKPNKPAIIGDPNGRPKRQYTYMGR